MRIRSEAARVAITAVIAGVVAWVGGPSARADAATPPAATLGIWTHAENSGTYSTVAGQHPNIANYYLAWGQAFPRAFISAAEAAGATPFIEIEPWHAGPSWDKTPSMVDIGNNDASDCGSDGTSSCVAWLASIGQDVKAFGHPIIFTFAHEFNVSGQYPWSAGDSEGTTPAQWIRAWDTVQSDINGNGARAYASWMWVPNADTGGTTRPFAAWWPGALHVDMVGVDGYPGWGNYTFQRVFGQSFVEMKALTSLPIFIAETDLAAETGASGTQTVTQFVQAAVADGASGLLVFQDGSPAMSSQQWAELDAALPAPSASPGSGTTQTSTTTATATTTLTTASPTETAQRCGPGRCVTLKVARASWRHGRLMLAVTGLPRGDSVKVTLRYRGLRSRSLTLKRRRASIRTPRPARVILRIYRHRHQLGHGVILRKF